jgi:hypothetical protein
VYLIGAPDRENLPVNEDCSMAGRSASWRTIVTLPAR